MLTVHSRKISVLILLFSFTLTACLRDPDPLPNAWDVMSSQPQLSIFQEAATRAEFDDDFMNSTGLTLFAPNNAAFNAWLDTLGLNSINEVNQSELQDLIRYHLIQGAASIADLGTNYYLTSSSVGPEFAEVAILIQNINGTVSINGDAIVTGRDLEAENTFIHTIDKVLKIPNTLDMLEANEEFSELVAGIKRAGITSLLTGAKAHTVLAPPNAAFEVNLPFLFQVEKVADMEQDDVDSLFRYHILQKHLPQEAIFDGLDTRFETYLDNRDVTIIDYGGGHVVNDSIGFLLSNIQAKNGVIHFVNNVVHHE